MAETQTKAAKSQDAEKAQEKKRRLEPASVPMKALADESIPFPGLLGVSAMEPPIERHAAVLGDPRFSHSANNAQKAGLITELQQAYGNQYVQRLVQSMKVQAKLTVSSPDDQYEREADKVADTVTRASAPSIQRQAEEEEEEEEEEPIQTKKAGGQTPLISSSLQFRINSLKGGGQPLPESTRSYFEPRFGADFSQVRVHTDSKASETAKSINAKAFTSGENVVFGAGQYSPATSTGKKLLAHELTHVIQQEGDNFRFSGGKKKKDIKPREEFLRSNSISKTIGLVVQRRFINRGRTGFGRVHWAGGTGGPGNEPVGSIQRLVVPNFVGRNPGRAGQVARAWIRPRTGLIRVVRSYIGVRGGDQGGGAGNRWHLTGRAARRVNRHSNLHSITSGNLYRRHLLPLLRLVGRHRGRRRSLRYGSTSAQAIARLRTLVGWNRRVNQFRAQDTAFNRPGGRFDVQDVASGTYPQDCRAGNVGAVHYDHRAHVPTEPCPT